MSFWIATIEIYGAFQCIERSIILAELHQKLPEQGMSTGVQIVQFNCLSSKTSCTFKSSDGLLRPTFNCGETIDAP